MISLCDFLSIFPSPEKGRFFNVFFLAKIFERIFREVAFFDSTNSTGLNQLNRACNVLIMSIFVFGRLFFPTQPDSTGLNRERAGKRKS
jgi:hypothetical protein